MRIPLARPYFAPSDFGPVERVLRSGRLTQGPAVKEFERQIAEYVGVKHGVATSSGSTALDLAMTCVGVRAGDEVIVPDFAFPATASSVIHCGGAPVFVDIEQPGFNIDPSQVRKAISDNTRAIVVVHAFGHPAKIDEILRIARQHHVKVIEDAAGALGASFRGGKVGGFGDIACLSFHPRKIITTGEGGMLLTNDSELAELALSLRNHGIVRREGKTTFVRPGFNYRMSDIPASLGLAQLRKIEWRITEARKLARRYSSFLEGIEGITCPSEETGIVHTYQTYCVMVDSLKRDAIIGMLASKGIETQVGYYALHLQDAFRGLRRAGSLENSTRAFTSSLALPMYIGLRKRDQRLVADALIGAVKALVEG